MIVQQIQFPAFSGIRCLMMPYIQGDPASVPDTYAPYRDILQSTFLTKGQLGFLTIDESPVVGGMPHRGARARWSRAIHTEAGRDPQKIYCWGSSGGGGGWGRTPHRVTLDADVQILLSSSIDDTCAVWDATHLNTSSDGDIGFAADQYPYERATFLKAGEVYRIGILTPHESVPVHESCNRQVLRIVSEGVHGREDYFTHNPLLPVR